MFQLISSTVKTCIVHHHHCRVTRQSVSIAISTSWRHFERSCACIQAALGPRLWGWRSSSIVRSHVHLGRPARRRQSAGGWLMAARCEWHHKTDAAKRKGDGEYTSQIDRWWWFWGVRPLLFGRICFVVLIMRKGGESSWSGPWHLGYYYYYMRWRMPPFMRQCWGLQVGPMHELAFRLYIGSFPCAQLPGPVHTARLGRVFLCI